MRFGVSAITGDAATRWQATARHAEAIGFDILTVPDHLQPVLSPFTAAAVAAEATDRLRVGTLVLNNDFRHPALVAREAASLGVLSDGRFELGLGAGHMKSEYDEVGMPFEPAAVRVARLAESVEIIAGMLAGEEVTFTGQHYRLIRHRGFPALSPEQRVPLLVGGNGRRVHRIAAEHADTVGLVGFTHEGGGTGVRFPNFTAAGLDQQISWLEEWAGDRFGQLELNALIQVVLVTSGRRTAADRVVDRLGGAVTVDEVLESPFLLIGTPAEMADQLRERQDRYGITYWTVFAEVPGSDQRLDTLAPVIERLA